MDDQENTPALVDASGEPLPPAVKPAAEEAGDTSPAAAEYLPKNDNKAPDPTESKRATLVTELKAIAAMASDSKRTNLLGHLAEAVEKLAHTLLKTLD